MSNKFKSYNYMSEADLQKLDFWNDNLPQTNPSLFKDILYKHGADTTKQIECVEDTHRMRTSNKTHTGKRWVFIERTDSAWLKSGVATIEAYLAASDSETMKDMQKMSKTYKLPQKKENAVDE